MDDQELASRIKDGTVIRQKDDDGKIRLINASGFVNSDIQLTIGILVSNRIQWISNVMESIKPLLDSLSCELIAVDTVKPGESDGSIDIVRKYTDKIYPFEWCRDFSKARNITLENAKGEWFLFIDDDEWFEDVSEMIEFFKSGESRNYLSGSYEIRSLLPNNTYSGVKGVRLIRRKETTRFVGRIHESLNEVFVPVKEFSLWAHHMGYCLTTEEAVRAHQERNISILKEELAERKNDARLQAQLVQEMIFTKGTEEQGFAYVKEVLSEVSEASSAQNAVQWMLTTPVRHCLNMEKYAEALDEADSILSKFTVKELASCVIYWSATLAAAHMKDEQKVLDYGNQYIINYDFLKSHNNARIEQSSLDMEKSLDNQHVTKILEFLIICYNSQKRYDKSLECWKKMYDINKTIDSIYRKMLEDTLIGLAPNDSAPLNDYLSRLYNDEILEDPSHKYIAKRFVI